MCLLLKDCSFIFSIKLTVIYSYFLALAEIGDVKHIISPNYEHVKYAQEWIDAYPNAISWACPGLKTLKPDIKYVFSIGESSTFHESWPAEMKYLWIDCERIPVIGTHN